MRKVLATCMIGIVLLLTGCATSTTVPGRMVRVALSLRQNAPSADYQVIVVDGQGYTRLRADLSSSVLTVTGEVSAASTHTFILYRDAKATGSAKIRQTRVCTVTTHSRASSLRFTTDGVNCFVN